MLEIRKRLGLNNQRGMTLLEIMIVLAILAGLIAVLAGQVQRNMKKAKINQAKLQIGEIGKALDLYYTDCNQYPSSQEGLEALIKQTPSCANWGPEPYIKKVPKDPWNNDFVYEQSGNSYSLLSLGSDKKDGGSGDAADISSENL